MRLDDELLQLGDEISAGHVLYRQFQAMKKDGEASQEDVNEVHDDLDGLIRRFRAIGVKADAETNSITLSEAPVSEAVERIRERTIKRAAAMVRREA